MLPISWIPTFGQISKVWPIRWIRTCGQSIDESVQNPILDRYVPQMSKIWPIRRSQTFLEMFKIWPISWIPTFGQISKVGPIRWIPTWGQSIDRSAQNPILDWYVRQMSKIWPSRRSPTFHEMLKIWPISWIPTFGQISKVLPIRCIRTVGQSIDKSAKNRILDRYLRQMS